MTEKLQIVRNLANLSTKDFTLSANQSSYESPSATYVVPAKRMIEIPNAFLGLKLMTKQAFSFTTTSGATTKAITTTYPIAVDPNITLIGDNVVVSMTSPSTGVTTAFTVTTPNTVTLSGLTGNTAYTGNLYYLFGSGSVRLTVTSSDGSATTTVLNRSIANVNVLNQNDVRVGLKPGMVGLLIPERWKIELQVNTAAPVCLYGTSETAYSSPNALQSFIELPVNISNLLAWPSGIKAYAKTQLMGV